MSEVLENLRQFSARSVPPRQKQGRVGETIDSPELLQSDGISVESGVWKSDLKVDEIKYMCICHWNVSHYSYNTGLINIKGFSPF